MAGRMAVSKAVHSAVERGSQQAVWLADKWAAWMAVPTVWLLVALRDVSVVGLRAVQRAEKGAVGSVLKTAVNWGATKVLNSVAWRVALSVDCWAVSKVDKTDIQTALLKDISRASALVPLMAPQLVLQWDEL